ncbi:hypothetical protein FPQ18DRAFT_419793 [Pyronema domesticum]|nr:hypothetical protein FPQ18DRAFT_419793 [Pyronema domesticum]
MTSQCVPEAMSRCHRRLICAGFAVLGYYQDVDRWWQKSWTLTTCYLWCWLHFDGWEGSEENEAEIFDVEEAPRPVDKPSLAPQRDRVTPRDELPTSRRRIRNTVLSVARELLSVPVSDMHSYVASASTCTAQTVDEVGTCILSMLPCSGDAHAHAQDFPNERARYPSSPPWKKTAEPSRGKANLIAGTTHKPIKRRVLKLGERVALEEFKRDLPDTCCCPPQAPQGAQLVVEGSLLLPKKRSLSVSSRVVLVLSKFVSGAVLLSPPTSSVLSVLSALLDNTPSVC